MDYIYEAHCILYEHCEAVMSSITTEFKTNEAMLEFTTKECAFILTEKLLEGKYTPMQYNAIRNELSALLWNLFEPHLKKERDDAITEFVKLFSI
jgi:hypothetical protein